MKAPIELLKETHLKLFNLCPTDALELKAKTISLLKDLPATEYQQLVHQIAQQRRVNENFLTWLDSSLIRKNNCQCADCEIQYV
jgi:hypothetical protein